MTKAAIRAAVQEARRFIEKAEAVEYGELIAKNRNHSTYAVKGKRTAAMKRASLDLTAALAAMRKTPRW